MAVAKTTETRCRDSSVQARCYTKTLQVTSLHLFTMLFPVIVQRLIFRESKISLRGFSVGCQMCQLLRLQLPSESSKQISDHSTHYYTCQGRRCRGKERHEHHHFGSWEAKPFQNVLSYSSYLTVSDCLTHTSHISICCTVVR